MSDDQKTELLNQMVSAVYEAVLDESQWSEALKYACQIVEVGGASLLLMDRQRNCPIIALDYGNDPNILETYNCEFSAIDPMYPVMWEKSDQIGRWFVDKQHVPEHVLTHSPFYHEFFRPAGVQSLMASWVDFSPQFASTLSLQRFAGQGDFDRDSEEWAKRIFPHFLRAVKISLRLGSLKEKAAFGTSALSSLAWPVWIVEGNGKINFANEAASKLERNKGFLIKNQILSVTGDKQYQFKRALNNATSRDNPASIGGVTVSWAGGSWLVLIVPVAAHSAYVAPWQEPMALVIAQDPASAAAPPEDLFRSLFGLTKAETRLAVLLASGTLPRDCADVLGVSLPTVRTQLRSLYIKCGTKGLPDLIRTLNSLTLLKTELS